MEPKASILVVDDEPSMRLAMSRVLERSGFEVTSSSSPRQALEALRARPWDAMVSDIRMPRMSGQELLQEALCLQPELKVVLVTAYGAVADAVEAIRHGASDYLLKPFAPDALAGAVTRCLCDGDEAGGGEQGSLLVGEDPAFLELVAQSTSAARTDTTLLITGESGTGKEVFARHIHAQSARAEGPFVAVNCAALPGDLLEAELFGVRKGAFTGADRDRDGHFQRADGGTLLLDEIGDCPLLLQSKLLRVLEERIISPLGSGDAQRVDIRIIAATHQDLVKAVSEGRFRQDLYFRLSVIPLEMLPLRKRPADIPLLARHLVQRLAEDAGRTPPSLSREVLARLARHPWPGNVRELRNVIERAVVLNRSGCIEARDLFLDDWGESLEPSGLSAGMTIAQVERRLIETTLEAAGGNRTRASEMLGISVRTLRNKLKLFREEESAALVSS